MRQNTSLVPRNSGAMVRESATSTEMTVRGETAAETMAARAQAEVFGAMQLAKKFPRSMQQVRERILGECQRPEFAAASLYAVPRGDTKAEGLTIRFAEALMRLLGNTYINAAVIYDDPDKRIVQIRAVDLETNLTITEEATVEKTVERRKLKRGQAYLDTRTNSYGDTIYIVEATDDDVRMKQAVAVSKAMRTCIIRLTPADIIEDAKRAVKKTLADQFKAAAGDTQKRIVEAFSKISVDTAALELYLGHPIAKATSDEVNDLRNLLTAIREEHTTWAESLQWKLEQEGRAPAPAAAETDKKPEGAA